MQFHTTFMASALAASFLMCFSGATHAQTADFTFDTLPSYVTHSPLTLTQNGITATFTDEFGPVSSGNSSFDDGQFSVVPDDTSGQYYSSAFSGNVLSSAAGFDGRNAPMVILFNQPISSISFDFALWAYPAASSPVTFSAYNGTTLVGTQQLTASPAPSCWFPEGEVNYTSAEPFSEIVMDANPAPFLILDNVEVTDTAPVPEASTVVSSGLLMALGLGGFIVTMRRRKAQITH